MKMTYTEKLIYLAGFIDGEGHFRITKVKAHKTSEELMCRPEIIIMQVDKRALDWCLENFGGNIYKITPQRENHNIIWRWILTGKKAIALAKEVEPYLIVKQEQVKRLTRIRFHRSKSRRIIKETAYN